MTTAAQPAHSRRARLALATFAIIGLTMIPLSARRLAGDEPPARAQRKMTREQTLKETIDGHPARIVLVELEYPPGGHGSPHRHPGPVMVYVLEGAIEAQIDGGPLKTYHKGETFFEPARALHQVSRNASKTEPARFLAYMLLAADQKELVLPPN